MGEGIGVTIEKALRARGRDVSEATVSELQHRLLKLYVSNPVVATRPYPHALDVLAELDREGVAIGVCTNKAEAPARLILEHTGLMAHVRAVVGGDSGYGLKPAAQPLRRCANLLGVALERTTYVGDHAVDLAAGRAAGVRVVLVTYGYTKMGVTTLSADVTIASLGELPTVLSQVL
jgi:phosphoglycolate phosphatase